MDTWQQVSISVTREAVEATANLFCEAGARNGVEIDDPLLLKELKEHTTWELCDLPMPEETEIVTVSAYYPEDEELSGRLSAIKEGLSGIEKRIGSFQVGQLRFRKVSEKDWANEWKQYFHTTKIGSQIVIKPDWESYTPTAEEKVIELDPGMAFGTGTHATTRMCIERLEELVTPNIDVYDVGTGSGILAMTAALMGARSIHAIDIDGKAVEVAKENIAKNHLSNRITVKKGNLLDDADEKADLIVANIIADIIIMLLPDAFKKLRQGGLFLASGVIKERLCDVEKAARQNGFTVLDVKNRAGWTAITMRKDA
ncbi:MAG: 50S ribosomal protein L11 methyltransferase [Acidaminococcus sp.]|uniref:Ribosomal protein L11 methyltransferase n=1 Tax=Acidaminococcus intestini TaxID=187327 RepID=A0A943ECG3_9FIRM|nr:50S ribosomal protein L11 methyltransferase [Acidaminococcus sp.]MBS5519116.1 50S ribosomal protein L11 methyltransferase [Acidaminococcus intestini]MDY2738455.1 50S ribosomal protein L11 methyltransferase [Acidaminococcus sp.]